MIEPKNERTFTTTRRQFLALSGAAALGLLGAGKLAAQAPAAPPAKAFKTKLLRAKILAKLDEKSLREMKEAGFDGVESSAILSEDEAKSARELAEKIGLRIHSVLVGGGDRERTVSALRAAKAYGAEAILLVPGRINAKSVPMPQAWEYNVQFDAATGKLTRVVAGDNAPYAKYIELHNQTAETGRELVKGLMPLAEELGVVIALENVWNNLWVTPDHFKQYVASFNSPWVRAYFDVANNEKYLHPAEEWIHTLGPLLAEVHIKDYILSEDRHGGKFVHPRDGGIKWPAVRQALEDVNYNGWITIEDNGLELVDYRKRLDEIIAGR